MLLESRQTSLQVPGSCGRVKPPVDASGERELPLEACDPRGDQLQKSQWGPGAVSSVRNGAPTGAMITLTSTAGTSASLRAMCP
jgi:hypothetical protein